MKKSSHSMERNICIYVLGLLVFLAISCSQDVLAVNNVTLKVNAGNNTTTANKIYFRDVGAAITAAPTSVTLPWTEKAVYNGTATADADVKITVTNEMAVTTAHPYADLIVKVDFLTATSSGAITVSSGWLKYEDGAGSLGEPGIVVALDNTDVIYGGTSVHIDKADLTTLVLKDDFVGKSTITLMNFSTKFNSPTHMIFTAILVNDASLPVKNTPTGSLLTTPFAQVWGVDVQSVFFNYIDTTAATNADWFDETPIWLTFIQAE